MLALGVLFSSSIDCGVGQADHHAPDTPQDARCARRAHSALIFAQGNIQAMMQAAFNDPIASLDGEHPLGLEFFQSETAQQMDHFTAPVTLPFNSRFQARCQASSGKAHLARSDFQAVQKSDFQPATVVLPLEYPRLGRRLRGKNSFFQRVFPDWFGEWVGYP